jgi:hypothetical protein
LHFTSPETHSEFVVMRADVFDRVKAVLDMDDFDPREAYPLVAPVLAEDDAFDPLLESYQKYRQ